MCYDIYMASITPTAAAALETLRAAQPFSVVPESTTRQRHTLTPRTVPAHIKTGINRTVLVNLRAAGLIACESIWAGGLTTPDLRIIETEAQ